MSARSGAVLVAAFALPAAVAPSAAAPAGGQEAAPAAGFAMTVRMSAPERADAVTLVRLPPGAPPPEFRQLAAAESGFRAEPLPLPEADADGVRRFRTESLPPRGGFVRIPVPLPKAAPEEPDALRFTAEITPPPGFRLAEVFPAPRGDSPDGVTRIATPAPPSLVRFRVVPEDASALGAAALVDGAALLLLLGLGGLGAFRLFRRPSGEAS